MMIDINSLITLVTLVVTVFAVIKIYIASDYKKSRMEEEYITQRQADRLKMEERQFKLESDVAFADYGDSPTGELSVESIVQEAIKNPEMIKNLMKQFGVNK